MTPAFNLLDEPWIPVRTLAGEVSEVGLLELFEHASQLEGLAETSPPNVAALYRMLLAITHRALTRTLGTWKDADRARWYRDGLPDGAARDYLEHWRDRFWVFHPEHPFMQVAALATIPETRDKLKPWTQVALGRANGNTPSVFDHAVDDTPTPARWQALMRDLLGFLQFTPGGLVRSVRSADKAGPLSNTAACIALGSNLSQTFCLALHPPGITGIEDLPAWERPAPTHSELMSEGHISSGPNDRYTRLSRSVLLAADSDGGNLIRWIRFAAGLALAADDNDLDPMASHRIGKNGKIRLTFSEGRALWRELRPWFQIRLDSTQYLHPFCNGQGTFARRPALRVPTFHSSFPGSQAIKPNSFSGVRIVSFFPRESWLIPTPRNGSAKLWVASNKPSPRSEAWRPTCLQQ